MDVAEVVARLGGTARTDQLAGLVSVRAVAEAVERGEVDRLALGRYGLPAAAETHRAAARLSATISCLSAAVEHGWEVLRQPDRPWLSVPPNRNVPLHRRRGVELLRTGFGGTVTSPVETVLECARRLPFPEALGVAAHAHRLARNPLESALRALSLDVPGLDLVPQRPVTVEGVTTTPTWSTSDCGWSWRGRVGSITAGRSSSPTTCGAIPP